MIDIEAIYTVHNIVNCVDNYAESVISDIQQALEQIKVQGLTPAYSVANITHELAYWSNLNAHVTGLWAKIRLAASEGSNKKRNAMRDYLEFAAQAARHKYDATSRVLTSYEILAKEHSMDRRVSY